MSFNNVFTKIRNITKSVQVPDVSGYEWSGVEVPMSLTL